MPVKDMTGLTIGMLRVAGRASSDRNGNARWHCVCACGTLTVTSGFTLRNGEATSCGCRSHGELRTISVGKSTLSRAALMVGTILI